MDTIKELYIDQMQDMWSSNNQAAKLYEMLASTATNSRLKSSLEESVKRTNQHKENLAEMIKAHGSKPSGEFCKGTEGLVKEAKAHAIDHEFGDDAVRDAMIISQFQRVTHYGLAGYGTILSIARQEGMMDDAKTLASDIDDIYEGDRLMTEIAEEKVNLKAAA